MRKTASAAGSLEEVAGMVCLLAGPQGGYITGKVISASGGSGL